MHTKQEQKLIKQMIKEQARILKIIDKKLTKKEQALLTKAFQLEHELTLLETDY